MATIVVIKSIEAGAHHHTSDRIFTTKLNPGERFDNVVDVREVADFITFVDLMTGMRLFCPFGSIRFQSQEFDGDPSQSPWFRSPN